MKYDARDDDWERLLERMNDALHLEFGPDEVEGEAHASAQIVGLPRSGTTLLMQLLAATGSVGYPSNIMAMFWRAPWVGARVQRQFAGRAEVSFHSRGGRTPSPLDPHEFGYFWRAALGHSGNTAEPDRSPWEPSELRRQLDFVTKAFGAPTVYKNFLAPSHLDYLRNVGSQRFLVTTRPLRDVAASLLQTRRAVGAPADTWFGTAPEERIRPYESEMDRVAYQVVWLQYKLETSGISAMPESMVVDHTLLCSDPAGVVGDILLHFGIGQARNELPAQFDVHSAFDRLDRWEAKGLARLIDTNMEEISHE